jgi:hypothetical protein
MTMRTALSIAVGTAAALFSTAALAQDATATGQVGGQVEPPKVTTTTTTTQTPATAAARPKDDGVTDHEKVVGKFGVGYFGITNLPIGEGGVTAVTRGNLAAPVIGMRYWLSEKMGLDIGLGFTFQSIGNREVQQPGGVTVSTDGPAALGAVVHGGLPLAFAYGKHYKFLLVPELNVGLTTRTEKAQNVPPGAPVPGDIHRSGFLLDIGARIGSEIQFGFIGIPELALQASVGLLFRRDVARNQQDAAGVVPETSSSVGNNVLTTTVQNDPWALFVNNISAIYYFP